MISMDAVLCDELLQEIFYRLPPSSSPAVCLVSRRWLFLLCSSLTTLSLRLPDHVPPSFVPSILQRYSSLSSLTLLSTSCHLSDHHLLALASPCSSPCRRHSLRRLRFLLGPVSTTSLVVVSGFIPFRNLTSLQLSCLRPLCFRWLSFFPALRDLSVLDCSPTPSTNRFSKQQKQGEEEEEEEEYIDRGELPLESLSLCGIRAGNHGLRWLWRRCVNLRRLQLRGCEGTGDGDDDDDGDTSLYPFARHLQHLYHLELRTCRSIADRVLSQIADNCRSLSSLLLYDGCSHDGLRRFIRRCSPSLTLLDFRLPLDLNNTHLTAAAERLGNLSTLRLQSCCLITGDGLLSICQAMGGSIEELVLVNCDVIDKETGLLSFLGQTLKRLRRVDLSHNEMLTDRELESMLVSSRELVEVRVRGCSRLTDAVLMSMLRCCERLEILDLTHCSRISAEGIELFAAKSRRLRRIHVEGTNVSESAAASASWAWSSTHPEEETRIAM